MNNVIIVGVLLGLTAVVSAVVLYFRRGSDIPSTSNQTKTSDNPYLGLRQMALSTTAEALRIVASPETTTVYGVIMDLGMDQGIVTIVSFQTGDASMYTSTGGGMLGAGKNLDVSNAAKHFVDLSHQYLDKAKVSHSTELPKSGEVIFYLFTNQGTYELKEALKSFDDKSSPLLNLFYEANNLINELRLNSN